MGAMSTQAWPWHPLLKLSNLNGGFSGFPLIVQLSDEKGTTMKWYSVYLLRVAVYATTACLTVLPTVLGAEQTGTLPLNLTEWKSGRTFPVPRTVTPGHHGSPPSDAIVLFNGKDLSQFTGETDKWILKDKCGIIGGTIYTKKAFGSCQLHVEWASPEKVEGTGQLVGNSGVFLMGEYEVQILDSYRNSTYPDGQTGAIYKQNPPLVNACRKPGEWQTYDIIFTAPRFNAQGKLIRPCYMTVLHNGLVVQNHFELQGDTEWYRPPRYEPHPQRMPLKIQYHQSPVRFGNIWIRELGE